MLFLITLVIQIDYMKLVRWTCVYVFIQFRPLTNGCHANTVKWKILIFLRYACCHSITELEGGKKSGNCITSCWSIANEWFYSLFVLDDFFPITFFHTKCLFMWLDINKFIAMQLRKFLGLRCHRIYLKFFGNYCQLLQKQQNNGKFLYVLTFYDDVIYMCDVFRNFLLVPSKAQL